MEHSDNKMKLKRKIMSVNKNIDRRIGRSGMEVDRGISQFMKKRRKSAMKARRKEMSSIFEVGGKKRTLLG